MPDDSQWISSEDLQRMDESHFTSMHWKLGSFRGGASSPMPTTSLIIGLVMAMLKNEWHPRQSNPV